MDRQERVVRKLPEAALSFGIRGLRKKQSAPEEISKRGAEKARKFAAVVPVASMAVVPANAGARDVDFTMTSATKILVAKSCPRASNCNN